MKRLLKSFRYGEKGFTLIELLVVIGILGILAAIVVPNFGKFFGRGQEEACEFEERMIESALMAWVADNLSADPTPDCTTLSVDALSEYFETPTDEIMGEYTFAGDYPACTVSQNPDSCP